MYFCKDRYEQYIAHTFDSQMVYLRNVCRYADILWLLKSRHDMGNMYSVHVINMKWTYNKSFPEAFVLHMILRNSILIPSAKLFDNPSTLNVMLRNKNLGMFILFVRWPIIATSTYMYEHAPDTLVHHFCSEILKSIVAWQS